MKLIQQKNWTGYSKEELSNLPAATEGEKEE